MGEGESSPRLSQRRRMQEVRKATVARGNNFFFLSHIQVKKCIVLLGCHILLTNRRDLPGEEVKRMGLSGDAWPHLAKKITLFPVS